MKKTTTDMRPSENAEMAEDTDNVATGMDAACMNSTEEKQNSEIESAMRKPTISEFQAVAKEFNEAFNMALYEIDSSRKHLEERSIRIEELNESIKAISSALDNEVSKGCKREEEYSHETEQLNHRINDIESERDHLLHQVNEQESILNERAEEISKLSSRIEELNNTLEKRTAESQQAQEDYVRETGMLTNKLDKLQVLFDETGSQLKAQQKELEDRDNEITGISRQVDSLTTELDSMIEASDRQEEVHNQETARLSTKIQDLNENLQTREKQLEQRGNELELKCKEASWLDDHINELKDEIDAQSESMRTQSESHASVCDELNAQINNISGELECLHVVHKELGTHAENIENLNRALHESSISENTLHKKVLEKKDSEIVMLQARLDAAVDSPDVPQENTDAAECLQATLHDLESRLKASESQKQSFAERANVADQLEAEVEQLRGALQEARDTGLQDSVDEQALQDQVANLESALENSRAEQAALSSLSSEVEKLTSALSASEEKCEQLQVALSETSLSKGADIEDTSPVTQDSRPLAEIANRDLFISHLNNLLAGQGESGAKQTVMYILLDNFVRIRNEIGIMNSEHVIDEISGIIASQCDNNDTIARFGDCTFAILIGNGSTDEAQEKAENIRSMIENHIFKYSEQSQTITTSIGICSIRKNDTSAEDVVSRADLACEAARVSGGNQVLVSSAIVDEMVTLDTNENHREMVSKTLSENRIKIYYQPISSLNDLQGSYYEVLTRVVDESGKIVLPGEFFSMAADSGQAKDIDLYVIESIMRMLSDNSDKEMKLFIKLTRQSVADQDLSIWITGKINEYRINPEQLVFEVSETILQSDLKNLSMLSKALNAIGCKIAIEHYQMATQPKHLQHVHANYIKIDSSLIESISSNSESLSTVSNIMDVARANNCITIAEGVESPACLAMLWELGVRLAQGYFIQAPAGKLEYEHQGEVSVSDMAENKRAIFKIG
jgi:diguanylate cyclase (GGDEF)-like protein